MTRSGRTGAPVLLAMAAGQAVFALAAAFVLACAGHEAASLVSMWRQARARREG